MTLPISRMDIDGKGSGSPMGIVGLILKHEPDMRPPIPIERLSGNRIALKIWRALREQAVVVFKTASGDPYGNRDLSLGIRRKTPTSRNAIWKEREAVRLVKRA